MSSLISRERLQRSVVNPVVKLAWRLRAPIPGDGLLETTGRRTGRPRRTPVCDGLEGDTFWLLAQRRDADWVKDIEAHPRVRVRTSGPRGTWLAGTARILHDDDPRERRRILSLGRPARALCLETSAKNETCPLTVRVDLDR